ncbi:MAG TPA: beta-1,3-glucanase family protein [Pirellulales bacterium]|nr:beta-1,3-glucanase family protein [Pirellulales bacterium]
MSEPKLLGLFRRRSGRKSSRRGFQTRDAAAYVEQLEPRRVLAPITPVVAATQYNDPTVQVVNALPGATLNVASTIGFASTGDLFVQTTTGVATLHYTGLTSSSFTGCSVLGDTYNVGAGNTTGQLDKGNLPAVFQATHDTFQITIPNQTNSAINLNYSMFWSTSGGDGDLVNFYALAPGNTFENFSNVGNGVALPAFSVAASGGTTTISLPYMPIHTARIFFSNGASSPIIATDQGGGQWAATQPTPSTFQGLYDYFEISLDSSGVNNTTAPPNLQYLPTLTIDSTQVDQFGIPMTLSGSSNNGATTTHLTSGVTDSDAVARDTIINEFSALHPSGSDPYSELVLPASPQSQGLPLRILNPGKVTIANTDPLGYLFDATIKQLFETSAGNLTLTDGTNTYTVSPTTVTAYGSDNAMHTYNVLAITGTGITGTAYVYEPFFSTNAPASASLSPVDYSTRPPAPKWLSNPNETAGQMVFGNEGVFTDYGTQLLPGSTTTKYDATTAGILANLENQIVSALNRGIATKYNDTADWQNANNFYPAGQVYNQYAQFLHQQQVHGTPIMIGGNAYAFAYDDQGGNSTTLSLLDQTSAVVTLGPWTASSPAGTNDGFLTAVYLDVLHRAVDPSGHTYWLGVLANGVSRTDVSQAIVNSVEHRSDIIEGFYTGLLNRAADPQGLTAYLQLFAGGWTASQIKCLFYGSNEYFQNSGSNNTGFTTALYQDELHRAPDSQAEAAMIQALAAGQSRTYIASLVVGSPEAEMDRVNKYYLDYLLRPADAAGLAYWNSVLARTDQDSLVEAGLLGSAEFFNRT